MSSQEKCAVCKKDLMLCNTAHYEGEPASTLQSDSELREKLAAIEHARWAKWQNYMHSFLKWNGTAWELPHEQKQKWQRQLETTYAGLSEKEKASDMEQVDLYWPLIAARDIAREKEIRLQARKQEALECYDEVSINEKCGDCATTESNILARYNAAAAALSQPSNQKSEE